MAGGAPVQAFTAIGEVLAEKPHQVDVGGGFKPYRRDVRFFDAQVASIRPLLQRLSFTRDKESWGLRSGAVFSASTSMITGKSPGPWVSRTRKALEGW